MLDEDGEPARSDRDRQIEEYRAEASAAWRTLLGEVRERYALYESTVGPLFDLPQLFIAT